MACHVYCHHNQRARASQHNMAQARRHEKSLRKRRLFKTGVPTGIRTPVIAVKGRCPRPLDDGDIGGAPGAIRTPDPLVRSQILYPTELRVRGLAEKEGFEPSIQV